MHRERPCRATMMLVQDAQEAAPFEQPLRPQEWAQPMLVDSSHSSSQFEFFAVLGRARAAIVSGHAAPRWARAGMLSDSAKPSRARGDNFKCPSDADQAGTANSKAPARTSETRSRRRRQVQCLEARLSQLSLGAALEHASHPGKI